MSSPPIFASHRITRTRTLQTKYQLSYKVPLKHRFIFAKSIYPNHLHFPPITELRQPHPTKQKKNTGQPFALPSPTSSKHAHRTRTIRKTKTQYSTTHQLLINKLPPESVNQFCNQNTHTHTNPHKNINKPN